MATKGLFYEGIKHQSIQSQVILGLSVIVEGVHANTYHQYIMVSVEEASLSNYIAELH